MVNKIPSDIDNPIDNIILKFIDTHLDMYYKYNFTPNMVTTLSLITGIITAFLITKNKFELAGLMYALSYYFDGVDGKLARKYNMVTIFGDYYDHFSDIFKNLLIFYVLYKNNSNKFKKIIIIIIILFILASIHLGCQQALYPQDIVESPTLDIFKGPKEKCKTFINKTKIFGLGTFTLFILLIIIFWKKIPNYIN
jgi:phosphatidylglycerophosphate synthase